MSNRIALLTGATGFVGRNVAPALAAIGFTVHPWRRDVHGSLLDPHAVRTTLAAIRPTHIIHCAWTVEHGKFWTTPDNLDWVGATLTLARAAAETGTQRLVGIGTCAEYDWSDGGASPRRESDPLAPTTLYGTAKDATRRVMESHAAQTGMSVAWGRLFHLYGEGEHPARLIPSLLLPLRRGEHATCRHGQLIRDLMDVREAGRAIAALTASSAEGAVNICTGEAITLGDAAGIVADSITGSAHLDSRQDDAPGQPLAMVGNPERLHRDASFTLAKSARESLAIYCAGA